MRLCLVISSLSAGGAERVISLLADEWALLGHEVHLLTTHDGGLPPHYRLDEHVRLRSIDPQAAGPRKQLAVITALRKEIAGLEPDVVVSFLNYTNILTLLACRGLHVPVVVSERLDPRVIGIGRVWGALRRITYHWCACLVAQTPTAARLYEHMAPGRIRVIPNPVVAPPITDAVEIQWPAPDRPTIIMVGRLQPQKGYDIAIRAMATLAVRHPEWRLVILGEGPLRAELEALRAQLGISDRVVLAGRVANPAPWLRRAQIFLLASRSEGFPNALCEAMVAGLPCVATDCPSGPSDIITPGVDGVLVPVDDSDAMAAAISEIIVDGHRRAALGAAAVLVAGRYGMPNVRAQWDKVLADVTASRAERART